MTESAEAAVSSPSSHRRAVLEAFFVTALWSSSYVLIDIGLADIPALTFAGLRYVLATAVLVGPFVWQGEHRALRAQTGRDWLELVALGVLLYATTQGAQFVALQYLRVATVSLVLTFTPAVVAAVSVATVAERPDRRQLVGLGIMFGGVAAYFLPFQVPAATVVGLGVMVVGLVANALASILGRRLNRDRALSALGVTTVSMAIGSSLLLGTGVAVQGLPSLAARHWLIVGWLAVANTAFAFTLWNRTLQRLTAVESSVLNNTMIVQVALLGWLFLGESLSTLDVVGLTLVGVGALVVQVRR